MGPAQLEISFDQVSESNLEQLKTLNRVIFPINYQDRVYQDILACGEVTQLAFHNRNLVGAIACRLENSPQVRRPPHQPLYLLIFLSYLTTPPAYLQGPKMYIITLGVLAPYRSMGVGSRLVERCLTIVENALPEIIEAYLHVQINNDQAIEFYRKFGFVVGETIENYYRRIEPPHAVLLKKTLNEGGNVDNSTL